MRITPWILLAGALFYILALQLCSDRAPVVPKDLFTDLQKRYEDTLQVYHQFRLQSDSALDNATASAIQANELAQQSQQSLEVERLNVNQILQKLALAELESQDSTWVQVSPRFKKGCDSLRVANLSLNYKILQYENDVQNQVDVLGYEVHLRDSLLERERGFNDQFLRQLNNCIVTGKQQETLYKQRTQLYGGIAIWGNPKSMQGGGEVNFALKTPRDFIYEVKGAYLLNSWWVGAGTKIKFHF